MTMRTDDTESDPRVDAEVCRALGIRSMVIFPVFYKDASAGILEVLSERPQAFDHVDLQLLPQLAELLTRLSNKFFAAKEMRKLGTDGEAPAPGASVTPARVETPTLPK